MLFRWLCFARASSFVRIVEPRDGSAVRGGTVRFVIEHNASLTLCAQLTNKRLTYESYIHCPGASEFSIAGVQPGVWRVRAYLTTDAPRSFSRRGAAEAVAADVAWFVADEQAWASALPRLRTGSVALAAANKAVEDSSAVLRATARAGRLAVSAANSPHVDLALNMAYSAIRAGAPPVFVFALSQNAEARLRRNGIATALLAVPAELDERRDVQTKGFGAIAAMKAACVLAVLRSGLEALWIDTDVVFFRGFDVQPEHLLLFDTAADAHDIVIQSGGLGPLDVARGEDHFHVEACTGIYLARGSPAVVDLFEAVIAEIDDAAQRVDWFGDQAATNLVLFERRFRGLDVGVALLEPTVYPGGGLFFERGGLDHAALAHNNFIVGADAKLKRFRRRALWFAESQPDHFQRVLARRRDCPMDALFVLGERPSVRGYDDSLVDNVVFAHDSCHPAQRAIATVSLGDRPWYLPTLLPRVKSYAKRTTSDLLVVTRACEHDNPYCYYRAKLLVAGDVLAVYQRVLLLDDTVAVRSDAPDVFGLVPPLAVGATVEGREINPESRVRNLLALSRLLYDSADSAADDSAWFNTGVLVLSWLHVPLVAPAPSVLETHLHYEQVRVSLSRSSSVLVGIRQRPTCQVRLSAHQSRIQVQLRWLVRNDEPALRECSLFFTTHALVQAPFPAEDAYFVHGTTGLAMNVTQRAAYFENLTRTWRRSRR